MDGTAVQLAAGTIECPSCGLLSPKGALICSHCGYNFATSASYGAGGGGRGTGFEYAGGSGGNDGLGVAPRSDVSAVEWLRALAWLNFGLSVLVAVLVWLFSTENAGIIGATILATLVLVEGAVVAAFLMVIAGMADTLSGIGEDVGMLTSLLRKR